jgi:hypothetical protein
MGIYHPQIKLRVIESDWFRKNNKMLKSIIKGYIEVLILILEKIKTLFT